MDLIQLNEDQKFQVLMAQLQERYCASHKMRERSTQFALWISGMAIGLAWILISQPGMTIMQRISLTLLIAALSIGGYIFIKGLQNGFQHNRKAMITCEQLLKMHEKGVYNPECSLLPETYACTQKQWSDHFNTLLVWISIVVLSLAILTWTCPSTPAPQTKAVQTIGKEK